MESINLDALSKHGLGKGAGKKNGKAKPHQKRAKQDSAITLQQVDGYDVKHNQSVVVKVSYSLLQNNPQNL